MDQSVSHMSLHNNIGNWINSHLDECPITAKCLRQMPVMAGCPIGFCYFSVLQPGTHITSHHGKHPPLTLPFHSPSCHVKYTIGATNLKLRAQFALQVPCTNVRQLGIRVGHQCRAWRQGEVHPDID
jgi:aspartyl/asparaginyl beta-hydroxylase (cupin superfamily)